MLGSAVRIRPLLPDSKRPASAGFLVSGWKGCWAEPPPVRAIAQQSRRAAQRRSPQGHNSPSAVVINPPLAPASAGLLLSGVGRNLGTESQRHLTPVHSGRRSWTSDTKPVFPLRLLIRLSPSSQNSFSCQLLLAEHSGTFEALKSRERHKPTRRTPGG